MNGRSFLKMLAAGVTAAAGMSFGSTQAEEPAARSEAVGSLPAGPRAPGEFGAYYTRLRYTDAWEKPWRVGDTADVVVRFDDGGHRFVFWRGTSYIPCWVTDNGIWYTNEFCETSGGGTEGCAEPMSDKHGRYTHVRILESTAARAVVHWRYALTDVHYRIAFTDPKTGWGDWADEIYTIYPDAVAVRKIVLWTARPDVWHEFQEAIVINPPGTSPEDNLETDAVLIANLSGETGRYVWDTPGRPRLTRKVPEACIEVIRLKARRQPFVAIDPREAAISTFNGHAPKSRFNCWDHWPISQDKSWTRVTDKYDRPSHTSLSWIANPRRPLPKDWHAHARTDQSVTKLLLTGLTQGGAKQAVAVTRSWLRPARLSIESAGYAGGDYDPAQRAYLIRRSSTDTPKSLTLSWVGSEASPIVNPCVIVRGWGRTGAAVKRVDPGAAELDDVRVGQVATLDGVDLVIWTRLQGEGLVRISIAPK